MAEIVEVLPGAPRTVAGRRRRLGYAMTLTAAALFAVNGVVAKVLLTSGGIDSQRLTQLRSTGAFVGLLLLLLIVARRSLRITRREIPLLAFYGVCGFAFVQWFYFLAIERLPVGIALLIQFTAPVIVALWARFAQRSRVRRRVWAALFLSLSGLFLVSQTWTGLSLDTAGVIAAIGAAAALAVYFIAGEHGVGTRDPLSLVCLSFLFATIFWAALLPWWSFPFDSLAGSTSLLGNFADVTAPVWALALFMIVVGTIIPFGLSIGALRFLPATIVGLLATVEPPIGAAVAYLWLDEALAGVQIAGGLIVLVGIFLAQTSR